MSDQVKTRLLIAAVALLVVAAVWNGVRSMRGTASPTVSPDFQRLSPQTQEQLLDQAERDRRQMGKAPARPLPEDRTAPNPQPR
jgi:hypothetical protein